MKFCQLTALVSHPERLFALVIVCALGMFVRDRLVEPSSAWGDENATPQAGSKDFEESWQVAYAGKARIGYSRSNRSVKKVDGREIVQTESETVMDMARFGQPVKTRALTSTVETTDGELLSFRFELNNPPAATKVIVGKVEKGKLLLDDTAAGRTSTRSMDWNSSYKAPGYVDRFGRDHPFKAGESRSFRMYAPEFNQLIDIKVVAGDLEEVQLLEGRKVKLQKLSVEQSFLPGKTMSVYVDSKGDAQKVLVGAFDLEMHTVPKSEALKKLSRAELDLGLATLVRVPGLDGIGRAVEAVYRIRAPNEDLSSFLPSGSYQSLKVIEKGVGDVTVRAIRPLDAEPAGKPTEDLQPYLKPNRLLQSDDPLVIDLANQAVGTETDPWRAARLMERWVYKNMRPMQFSTMLDSASEVAKSRTGDCTERAVLLAAMARTKKIPSRCAIGLVYVPSLGAFGGHMWTEVFIRGSWIPLDATMGLGRVGPDHIKFGHVSFTDNAQTDGIATFVPLVSVVGKMSVEVRSIEK